MVAAGGGGCVVDFTEDRLLIRSTAESGEGSLTTLTSNGFSDH